MSSSPSSCRRVSFFVLASPLRKVVGNAQTIERLKVIAEEGNMPNLIISGPPGTGKTTSMHALAHTMLGDAYAVRFIRGGVDAGCLVEGPVAVTAFRGENLESARLMPVALAECLVAEP